MASLSRDRRERFDLESPTDLKRTSLMQDIRAAAVQFQHAHADKAANLRTMEAFITRAAEQDVQLLTFPECCVTGYWGVRNMSPDDLRDLAESVPDGPTTQWLIERSQQHDMLIGAGLIEVDDHGHLFNSFVVALPDGTTHCHRKLHCFISKHMQCGDRFTVFDTPWDCRVGVLICYDNNIIENVRATALLGADVLLAPHQTGGCKSLSAETMGRIDVELWENRDTNPDAIAAEFKGPKGREWLNRWLPSRAHDNGLFIIFSNGVGRDDDEVRTGNSTIYDPYGRELAATDKVGNDMIVADLKASLRENCTAIRWMRARRPDLYPSLTEVRGDELSARAARFGD